jgi:hypothetical protein
VKPIVNKYQDDSTERLTEISSNLNQFFTKSPEMFNNYDVYKQNFDYNSRSPQQKQVLDSFFQNKTKLAKYNT